MARQSRLSSSPLLLVYAELIGPRGHRMLRLALDTGATYTMLPPEKLLLVGLAPHATKQTIEIMTASGIELAPWIRVNALRFLGVTVRRLPVIAHALPPTSPVEGLLGLNALMHFPPFREFLKHLQRYS